MHKTNNMNRHCVGTLSVLLYVIVTFSLVDVRETLVMSSCCQGDEQQQKPDTVCFMDSYPDKFQVREILLVLETD
jgi:hypothetical protein